MRSQSRTSLSTLLFLLPLLGVPLMAIFGVPQFVPVIASSVSEETPRPSAIRRSRGVGESAAAASLAAEKSPRTSETHDDEKIEDLFRPAKPSSRDSRPLGGESSGRQAKFVETSRGADTWLTQTSAEAQASDKRLNDLFGESEPSVTRTEPRGRAVPASLERSATNAEHSDQGLTWREAVRRLNELGIQEFRLEPGRQVGEFYFACEFTPDRDTRITRRFEAEAKEPLLAVAAVLRQIEEWLPRR